jgi:hypothetical protein
MNANQFHYTAHLIQQAQDKGIQLSRIMQVLEHPTKITPVTRYPNQSRYIGQGIAVIVCDLSNSVITVYLDGVVTPLRPDQIARGETIKRNH